MQGQVPHPKHNHHPRQGDSAIIRYRTPYTRHSCFFNSANPYRFQWASPEANEDGKVFQQKLRVTYLPAEGQVLEEEEENPQVGMTSVMTANDSVSLKLAFISYIRARHNVLIDI